MEQTNRTILFEEINPEKDDLLTLITEDRKRKGLNDEEIFLIHERLVVSSYDDFLNKFDPAIRMQLDTEHGKVDFGENAGEINCEVIKLKDNNSLLSMFIRLMEAKKKHKYLLTCFEDMHHNIIPQKDVIPFWNERNDIYEKIENGSDESVEQQLLELIQKYDNGLFLLDAYIKELNRYTEKQNLAEKPDKGIVQHKKGMQIRVVKKAARYKQPICFHEKMTFDRYQVVVEKCMQSVQRNGVCKNVTLMKACLLLPMLLVEKRYFELQQQYETYLRLYETVYKKFWIAAKPLFEKVLGIREFFEPYQQKEGMRPSLLIANFKPERLMQSANRENLELYLNTVNMTNYHQNVLWYAIVPNVSGRERGDARQVRERFMSTQEKHSYSRNGMEETSLLLEMLAKYKIQSFLSMELTQEHTFSTLAKRGLDSLNGVLQTFEQIKGKDYCIPCFPNFILISKEDAYQIIGKNIEFDELAEEMRIKGEKIIWLDEIGIEASYVAAGLVAACQCPKFLKACHEKGINENLPGVAYRFSQGQNYLKTTVGMLSETIELTPEMEQEVIMHSKGILFGQRDGKMVILTDRVLSYNAGNKLLISMVQTMNYIERRIQYDTQDFKKHLIEQFFQRKPGSTITTWGKVKGGELNALLREEEELEYQIDEKGASCTFQITFKNDEVVRNEKVRMFRE